MIVFIVNPKSGAGRSGRTWPHVEKEVQARFGNEYRVRFTEHPLHAVSLTREELRKGADCIVSVGGDGTLNEVVNGFFHQDKPVRPEAHLSVLCFGTGADFVRSIHWPREYKKALERLESPQVRKIDLGRATFFGLTGHKQSRYFINITDFGIGGAVVDRVNRTTKIFGGKISFLWAIIVTFFTYENKTIQYKIDDGEWQTQVLNNFIVGNGRYFGGGLNPTPTAELDDGLFDVVTIGDVTLVEAVRNLSRLRAGTHLTHPKIRLVQARRVAAKAEAPVYIDMDGEYVGQLPIEVEVIPRCLQICT